MIDQGTTIKHRDDKLHELGTKISELQQDSALDNRLELLKKLTEVSSRIKSEIKEDFVFAKLDEKHKEAVIEMTTNAYFSKSIVDLYGKLRVKYEWLPNEKKWKKTSISKEESKYMTHYAERIFDSFMTRIYMIVVLNRNVAKNDLIRLLAGFDSEETDTRAEIKEDSKKLKDIMGEMFKREDKPKES